MELFNREFGQGPPLLIVHGLFGSSDNWYSIAKKFSQDFTVHTIDLRNHGNSPHHDEFNYKIMTRDLDHYLKRKGIIKASIIGHSMGGKLAMNFTLKNPKRIQNLVVVDIAPRPYPVHHDLIIDSLLELNLQKYKKRDEVDEALSDMIPSIRIRQFLLKNLKREENGGFTWKINLKAINDNIENIVSEITSKKSFNGKTLFIAGDKSDYIRPVDEEQILNLFPKAEVIYLPKVGHWVHAEAPDLLYNTIIDYIK